MSIDAATGLLERGELVVEGRLAVASNATLLCRVTGPAGEARCVYKPTAGEKLEEEKAALSGDIREVYSEAKGVGFDTKIMRQLIRLRRMDRADRREQEELLDLYKRAIGLE